MQGMNQSVNRTIGMVTEEISEENKELVFAKLYGSPVKLKQPTYKIGDLVLLSKYVNPLGERGKRHLKKVTRQTLHERVMLFQGWIEGIQTFTRLWTKRIMMSPFWDGFTHKS